MRKTCTERRKISLLNDLKIRKRFREEVINLVDVGLPNLWEHLRDGILKACNEVCGKNKGMIRKGDKWWWNEEVEADSRKKEAHKAMCRKCTVENKRRYKSVKK